jgi:hypothetical protein
MEKPRIMRQLEVFLRYRMNARKPLEDDRARRTATFAERVFRRMHGRGLRTPAMAGRKESDSRNRLADVRSCLGGGDQYNSG